MGTTVTNKNLIAEEIKSRLNSGDACCNLVKNLPGYYPEIWRLKYTEQ